VAASSDAMQNAVALVDSDAAAAAAAATAAAAAAVGDCSSASIASPPLFYPSVVPVQKYRH